MKTDFKSENNEFYKDKIVGVFQKNKNFGFVVPDDKKIKIDVYISKKNSKKAKNNQKVVVQIIKKSEKNKKPEGKIIEILGNVNQAGIDMLSLVKEYNLPYEFPDTVINEAKTIKQELTRKEILNRLDLREKEIFTIDGEDAKDLDDAISVEKLKNGNFLLYVSISDVSHYVQENSNIDKEAIIRGTSIYMLDRVIPMLPKELSNGICSLNEKQDRLAITVIMEIDKKGDVIYSNIQKSIINVTRRMSYKEIQTILDELEEKEDKKLFNKKKKIKLLKECETYFEQFKNMSELANILKDKRAKAGSLNLNIPESKITLNKNGLAIKVQKCDMFFANEIIEQFMLIANETVAEKFYWLEIPFIYRVHEAPDIEKINELNKLLWNFGYKIKINKENIYPKAFAELLEKVKDKPEERVVSNLILRTLKVARYEAENKGHFGIASKYYCHFTSPIRRYPDLFIHRIITKYLEKNYQLKETEVEKYNKQAVKYADLSSEREKIAQKVEREAENIKKAEYMQSKIGELYDGIISNITSFGIFVELSNTVEGFIHFENLGNEYFIYDEENKILQGEKSKETYKIGDNIKVKVIFADKTTARVDFKKI